MEYRMSLNNQTAANQTAANHVSTESHYGAKMFVDQIRTRLPNRENLKILIAGCGSGHEAFYIRESTGATVHSVDIEDYLEVDDHARSEINFMVGSVCELPFEANYFDAVFYYHVIEHVDRPDDSLTELHRVIKENGWVFVGTPNRSRVFSSIGAHTQSEWNPTIYNKLCDNLRDWKDRLTGRFHNHFGAHAGYSTKELDRMTRKVFQKNDWVTQKYLRGKYQQHRLAPIVKLATAKPLHYVLAPSIYVWCQKSKAVVA